MIRPMLRWTGWALFLSLTIFPTSVLAQEEEENPIPDRVRFESSHSGTFGEHTFEYQAVVTDIRLKREDGAPFVRVFTTSYLREDVRGLDERPVTFVFNGGPGSASLWLHFGMMGPRIVDMPSDAEDPGPAPWPIVGNPASPLDVTDLVFIDPPGTGFSRLVGDGKPEDVYGLREDARTIAAVVKEWLRENHRWNSPIYLAGESFGTTRAAAMLPELMGGSEPVAVKGVILISQCTDYTGGSPYYPGNLPAFVLSLPTMAAIAWYHEKVDRNGRSLEAFLDEVRSFAVDTYLPALFKGSYLDDAEEVEVARLFAAYTGLDQEYVLRSRLRVSSSRFRKELLRDEGLAVGGYDGRYTSDEIDDVSERPSFDASDVISAPYMAAVHEHFVGFLGVDLDRPYHTSGPEVDEEWVWDRALSDGGEPTIVNTAPDLAHAMSFNPDLSVLIASGYYDLVTPFFDAEYTTGRYGIDASRVTFTYYEAGHMMYLHVPSREAMGGDIRAFIVGS